MLILRILNLGKYIFLFKNYIQKQIIDEIDVNNDFFFKLAIFKQKSHLKGLSPKHFP